MKFWGHVYFSVYEGMELWGRNNNETARKSIERIRGESARYVGEEERGIGRTQKIYVARGGARTSRAASGRAGWSDAIGRLAGRPAGRRNSIPATFSRLSRSLRSEQSERARRTSFPKGRPGSGPFRIVPAVSVCQRRCSRAHDRPVIKRDTG